MLVDAEVEAVSDTERELDLVSAAEEPGLTMALVDAEVEAVSSETERELEPVGAAEGPMVLVDAEVEAVKHRERAGAS